MRTDLGRAGLLTQNIHDSLVHGSEQVQQILGEQAEGHEGNVVFGLILERLSFVRKTMEETRSRGQKTDITLDQHFDLILYGFCLSKETFCDAEILQAAGRAYMVDVSLSEGFGTLDEVIRVSADILALSLDCRAALLVDG